MGQSCAHGWSWSLRLPQRQLRACERVFSLVERMFGRDQESALADQIQAGVMLRYNKRHVTVG